ncbi:hypothetical protein FRC03_000324 [Tulasnella sp. 419]|nr:hypothetical protein FRC03_000324 [Tulasnella sp. 419]
MAPSLHPLHRAVLFVSFLPIWALAVIPPELYSPLIPQKVLKIAERQDKTMYPQWTAVDQSTWQYYPTDTWTSGFFPASMMLLNERGRLCPGSNMITNVQTSTSLSHAREWSESLTTLEVQNNVKHDVGFISFPFWEELKINSANSDAAAHVNAFAKYLAGRFNPRVGCTESWDTPGTNLFKVIIDNMINLELFFISADLNGNNTYRQMAMQHADHTMQNHIRNDGSTFHVVIYDRNNGTVVARQTSQGFSDGSTWTRGQAWAMYGFTSIYNRTGEQRYLETARKVSQFYIDSLPSPSTVPPWDFNAPQPAPRDTSSAMIAANALLFLSQMEKKQNPPNNERANYWTDKAITLLTDTVKMAWRPEPQWEPLLSNGTANKPAAKPPGGNYNTGLVYGDYYFIKAGNTLLEMGLATCSSGSGTPTQPDSTNGNFGTQSSAAIQSPVGLLGNVPRILHALPI